MVKSDLDGAQCPRLPAIHPFNDHPWTVRGSVTRLPNHKAASLDKGKGPNTAQDRFLVAEAILGVSLAVVSARTRDSYRPVRVVGGD